MKDQDIRWQQRLNHFQQALAHLDSAVKLSRQRPLSRIEQQGLIKAFEFTHELAWNVVKDFSSSRASRQLWARATRPG